MFKRILSWLLVLAMVVTMLPVSAMASVADVRLDKTIIRTEPVTVINPLYADVLPEDLPEIPAADPDYAADAVAESEYLTDFDAAVDVLREGLVNRQSQINVYYVMDAYYGEIFNEMFLAAREHTGEPKEGDSLSWGWSRMSYGASYYISGGVSYVTLTFSPEFYTTAAQEAELDVAVNEVLELVDTTASDYEQIKTVYDYICANVTYDYDNLEIEEYTLKYTPYAALLDGTAVCQGYALLLYRFALELGIDCRLIAGSSKGNGVQDHGWNIVKLNGKYYNADSTWDAGYATYQWFLQNEEHFTRTNTRHIRSDKYNTEEFHAAYPMGETDFDPNAVPEEPDDGILDEGTCGDSLTWVLTDDGVLTISGEGEMYDYGYLVSGRKPEEPWLEYNDVITTVIIEDGVTSIGVGAFEYFTALTSVTIPDTVTKIGICAFFGCSALPEVILPAGVSSIGMELFCGCASLESVNIPANVTSIGGMAFMGCTSLKSVNIPECVTTIEYSAFQDCAALTSVTIPDNVTSIGDQAFMGCTSLASVNIPDGNIYIRNETFKDCTALTSVTVPASVTDIHNYVFEGCSELNEVRFEGNAPTFGANPFTGVTATVYYPSNDPTWTDEVMQQYGGNITWVAYTPVVSGVCGDNLTWILDDGVLTVSGEGEMWDFDADITRPWNGYEQQIHTLVIEEGVTSVGTYAFTFFTELSSLTLPEGLTRIGNAAFAYAGKLIEVDLPDSLVTVEDQAFAISGLTEVTVGANVSTVGTQAFCCENLTAIYVDRANPNYYSVNGVLFHVGNLVQVPPAMEGALVLPESTFSIYPYALSGCKVTGLTVPAYCGELNEFALAGADELETIQFRGDAPVIPANAFDAVTAVVTYPGGNTTWTDEVKQNYGGTIEWQPEGEDLVAYGYCGENSYYGKENPHIHLDSIAGTNATWKLTTDGTLTISGEGRMMDCGFQGNHPWMTIAENDPSRIIRVVLEEGITYMGFGGFMDEMNVYVQELSLPSTLTEIGDCACYLMSALEKVTIPASVTSIGQAAFASCASLTEVRFCGNAPAIHENAFPGRTVTAYYPANDPTWTEDVRQNYGGTITWEPYYVSNLEALTVGGVDALAQNDGEGWNFEPETDTLYLWGCSLDGEDENGIYAKGDLTICLVNETGSGIYGINTGVLVEGNLTITGPGHMRATASAEYGNGGYYGPAGICVTGDLTLVDTNVTAESDMVGIGCLGEMEIIRSTVNADGARNGIYTKRDTRINASTVYARSTSVQADNKWDFRGWFLLGIFIHEGDLTIENGSSVYTSSDQFGAYAVNLNVVDSYLNACATLIGLQIGQTVRVDGESEVQMITTLTEDQYEEYGEGQSAVLCTEFDVDENLVINGGVIGDSLYMENAKTIVDSEGKDSAYASIVPKVENPSGFCGENVTWELTEDGTLIISGEGDMDSYSSANGQPWHDLEDRIYTVLVSGTVNSVGAYAFYGLPNLSAVLISEGVTAIGGHSMKYCSSLSYVSIPGSVTEMGPSVFAESDLLTSAGPLGSNCNVEFGWTEEIPADAFNRMDKLSYVQLPDTLVTIGDAAFLYCAALTTVELPDGLAVIGEQAFESSGLTSIVFPDGVSVIGTDAFEYCPLVHVDLPAALEVVSARAFHDCDQLTTVTIPENVTEIAMRAFWSCDSLESVTFYGDAPAISDRAFEDTVTTAYYPVGDTWTEDVLENYGGTITWVPCYAIEIITQPVDYVGMVGDIATFTVEAEGDGLTYQWYYYDTAASKWNKAGNGTEATLSVEFRAYRNGQYYYCEITDAEGNAVVTDTVSLIAKEVELKITGQSYNYEGAVNDEVTFTVEAEGNGLVYQWYFSTDGGEVWQASGSPGCTTNTLKPILRTYRDGYLYFCIVTDIFGNEVSSEPVRMSVKSSAVEILAQPEDVEMAILSQLYQFHVTAEGENLTYLWEVSSDGGVTWEQSWNQGYNTPDLSVRMNANRDGNLYRCVVTSGQKVSVVTDAVILDLQDPSVELISCTGNVSAVSGKTVSFRVEATGNDLTYLWYRSNDKGATWVQTYLTGYNTNTLEFVANQNRAAIYKCKITDGSGKVVWSDNAKLQILTAELAILTQPESVICAAGDLAVFTVKAQGDTLTYQWYASADGGATWTKTYLGGYNIESLSFTVNASRAAKIYKCVITDAAGNMVETNAVSVTME